MKTIGPHRFAELVGERNAIVKFAKLNHRSTSLQYVLSGPRAAALVRNFNIRVNAAGNSLK